uniref:Uncharacterized protein n=1 Tax=Ditylenchus dipsaci TaxID=166011 RepID=A0A915E003_9BILA
MDVFGWLCLPTTLVSLISLTNSVAIVRVDSYQTFAQISNHHILHYYITGYLSATVATRPNQLATLITLKVFDSHSAPPSIWKHLSAAPLAPPPSTTELVPEPPLKVAASSHISPKAVFDGAGAFAMNAVAPSSPKITLITLPHPPPKILLAGLHLDSHCPVLAQLSNTFSRHHKFHHFLQE